VIENQLKIGQTDIPNIQIDINYYCIHCHGKHHGTVGQSFAPKPRDLRSAKAQETAEGRLFHEISYGIPGGRQPALATTMAVDERWQVIGYLKSLGIR
jgi:hypothetical protein